MSRIIKGPVRAGSSLMPGGAFNRSGRCIGETHRHARLSDEAVDAMRTLAQREGLSLARLARLFHCGKSTVRDIVPAPRNRRFFRMGLDIPRVALLTGHKTWAMLRGYTNIKLAEVHAVVEPKQAKTRQQRGKVLPFKTGAA